MNAVQTLDVHFIAPQETGTVTVLQSVCVCVTVSADFTSGMVTGLQRECVCVCVCVCVRELQ